MLVGLYPLPPFNKLNYINEPLLVPDLPRYVEYARARGVLNTYFATNGLLLTEEMSRSLIDVRLTKLMVSLDAVTPETFWVVRRSRKLDVIIRNVLRLIELRNAAGRSHPLVRVNFLKTSQNMHEAEAFVEQWSGVADMLGFQDRIFLPGVEDELKAGDIELHRVASLADFRCSFPFKMVIVDSAGQILPCCTFSGREIPLGHVRDSMIKQAWDSPGMRALQRQHATGTWRQNPVCVACIGEVSDSLVA